MAPRLPARCWRQLSSPSSIAASASLVPRASLLPAPTPITLTTPSTAHISTTSTRSARSGWSTLPPRTAKPYRFNQATSGLPTLTTGPAAALKRKERTTPVRTGVLAVKKGMTVFMGRRGARIPCTVLQLDRVQTVFNKTRSKHGYWAVQVGMGERHPDNVGAPLLGYFEAKGIPPKEILAEFRVRDESGLLPVGVQLMPDWFQVGQRVDVRSNSRGMGFAGGMKRHGFAGQEKSHGNSLNHRTIGSVGPSQGSGSRVLPGKKMPGRMGNQRVTVQNLPVLLVDNDLGIVVVKGCVAGPKGCVVRIQDACKKEPPPKEFVEKARKVLEERFPDAEAHLQAARERHLELKAARREKRIAELMEGGLMVPQEQAEKIEQILAAEAKEGGKNAEVVA
ncbi:hypothetical protein VTJ49DRAFT_2801 [Mycothermus thermophilus]|uniref:Large ribosomal subunit protein uL3m n=1 Tax=Humicola insolens TaxID=85995 RepID=A0ABR3V9A1_HUMIN